MESLSKRAEELLLEVLEHRDIKGNCDANYWKERFDNLSVADDALLRSLFKELSESNMISAHWADNYPYILLVLAKGLSYFEEKEKNMEEKIENVYETNFYGAATGVQIQQGTYNSKQSQTISQPIDNDKILEILRMIKNYDLLLDDEYGKENASKLRESVVELETATRENKPDKKVAILRYIRDLSVNAGGGLIAAGIVQTISSLLG